MDYMPKYRLIHSIYRNILNVFTLSGSASLIAMGSDPLQSLDVKRTSSVANGGARR